MLDSKLATFKTAIKKELGYSKCVTLMEAAARLSHLDGAPSSPTDSESSDSSSSGTNIGVIVGAAVGGVVLLAVLGGLIFWCYRRRQRRARSNAEPDLGIGDFVMDKAVEHVTKEEEASSETSDVAVEF
ncbi:hypothetical protein D9Q98_004109 [Chlorella vulgaris]|uniref:Mid2 domain-containing protein n=1 Tax=Chlorella vulgaris TaxID=3077 RepID=A0A9D4TR94_CHLVU|nr:hypothetical protein D9Q98_004109 [Chlorella vulgaris]